MKIVFGKYVGCDLRNIPRDYLVWLLSREIDDYLRRGIEETLAQWDGLKTTRKKSEAKRQTKAP